MRFREWINQSWRHAARAEALARGPLCSPLEAVAAYLHLYVRIYQICLVLSLLQAWVPLTGLLIQCLYSSTGYQSRFNSSLLAHLSIPSPWLLVL